MINAETIHAAATIIGWQLHEARGLLSDLDTRPSLSPPFASTPG